MQQTQVIAAAAAGVAAGGLSPEDAKVEAENAAQLSVALVENAIVILMLVEDHLRLQSKLYTTTRFPAVSPSPLSKVLPMHSHPSTVVVVGGESLELLADRKSSTDSSGVPLDVSCKLSNYDVLPSFTYTLIIFSFVVCMRIVSLFGIMYVFRF